MDRRLILSALLASAAVHARPAQAVAPAGDAAEARTLRFEIDMAAEIAAGRFDPARDTVVLMGAAPPLSWSSGLPLRDAGGGLHVASVPFDRLPAGGQGIQHKARILRPGAAPDAGWEPGRNHVADPAAGRVQRRFGAEPAAAPTRLAGTVLSLDVPTQHIAGPRKVWVWLPPGHDRPQQRATRYPVLVLHDGQNVFDAASAGAEWQVDEAAQQGVQSGTLLPFIVVAVASGADRVLELTPSAAVSDAGRLGSDGRRRLGGGLHAYARFLADDLLPMVHARFPALPGRANLAVGGSSLGGLASLALALEPASPFGAALVVSPSVWWDDGWALRAVQHWSRPPAPPDSIGQAPSAAGAPVALPDRPRLWLDIGAHEGPRAVHDVRRLRDALLARGWTAGVDLAYAEDPDGTHDEASWSARVPQMLRFLYPGTHHRDNRR